MKSAAVCATALLMSSASAAPVNYSAERTQRDGIDIVRLSDQQHRTTVSIVPSIGNIAFEMMVNGKNALWFPFASLADFRSKPALCGVPLLAPWANRLDEDGFWANGKHYGFDRGLKNIRMDSYNHPIHGLLSYAHEWEVLSADANDSRAQVTSRLEFWKHPDYMAQFPFAHTLYMTYRLQDGMLEVETTIENHSAEPMPVSVGFHPYFQLKDKSRNTWNVRLPVREQMVLSQQLIPTGETKPNPYGESMSLAGTALDDVFSGLVRGESGRAEFSVSAENEKISVMYGPKYTVAVVYAPPGRDFICFEPMSGPTNAFNLHHAGKYQDLQSVPAGGKWKESFWIRADGF